MIIISRLCRHTRKSSENCVYVLAATKMRVCSAPERLLQMCSTFTKSVIVSMGVSKLGRIDQILINARVQLNDAYCREVLLTQKLLPVMHEVCGKFFIFQQGNVPAHRSHGIINLLFETPVLILPDLLPPISIDLNPIDYKHMGVMQQRV